MLIRRRRRLKLMPEEREQMRAAGRFNAQLMDFIRTFVEPGVSTLDLDAKVHQYTLDHGHSPACLGYPGDYFPFPKSCCISVNEVICHGIPDEYRLQEGDIVNIDLTTIVDGWFGDQSETFLIGDVAPAARDVVQCAFDSLHLAIAALTVNCPISDIGEAVVKEAAKYGFGVVDRYVGHGIGMNFHQRPNIPHVPTREASRQRLEPGICFTIEPMINVGGPEPQGEPEDGWTIRTADGSLSAQFEHTLMMTEDGAEILTETENGPKPGHQF